MTKICFLFVVVHVIWAAIVSTSAQRHPEQNPYSLQTAINLLHRREAQLALRDYENAHNKDGDESHLETDTTGNASNLKKQKQINRLLARYLEADEENEPIVPTNDDFYDETDPDLNNWYSLEERKRSVFRERGNDDTAKPDVANPQSVFRERELENADNPTGLGYYANADRSELAQEFVQEINNERNRERDELYRENVRRLLAKYEQQQENAIEREILADELQRNAILEGARLQHELKDRNNHQHLPADWDGDDAERTIEKRRLVLPWLPAVRRKRFPISKRSPASQVRHDLDVTNDKVAHDLQAIFGDSNGKSSNQPLNSHKVSKKSDRTIDLQDHSQHQDEPYNDQILKEHFHHKSKANDEDKILEHDHDHDNGDLKRVSGSDEDHSHEEHSHEHDSHEHDDEDDEGEDDDRKKKKKRSTTHNVKPNITSTNPHPEELKLDQLISSGSTSASTPTSVSDKSILRNKKSIQWSKYFGLDRKKKSVDDWFMGPHKSHQFAQQNLPEEERDEERSNENELSNEKIDNIDRKLKAIENHIVEDTVKYTGAHDRAHDPEELEVLKNRVISRLATAYSLEKMRRALNKLRVANQFSAPIDQQSSSASESSEELIEKKKAESDKAKRVAVKKEKVEFDNKLHTIESAAKDNNAKASDSDTGDNNSFDGTPTSVDDDKKKKKKRNDPKSLLALVDDSVDERGVENYSHSRYDPSQTYVNHFRNGDENLNECPILDAIDKRCESVDLLSGGGGRNVFENDSLLPACSMHQFCYLCGTSQTFCDFQYLSDTEAICGGNKECQSTAHLVLMILRGSATNPQQVGPKECAKNPCLLQAMKNVAGY